MVEHSGTHSDQRTIPHLTTMQRNTVADGNVVAQNARRFAVESMDTRVVLDVRAIANLHEMYIATNDGIEPNRAVVAHFHVAHYRGTLAEVAMFAESGSGHPLECLDYCHFFLLNIDH
jgi:hypothetical protein